MPKQYETMLNNMGHILRKLGRYMEAVDYFEKSIEIFPLVPSSYCAIGMIFSLMAKWKEAVVYLDKVSNLKILQCSSICSFFRHMPSTGYCKERTLVAKPYWMMRWRTLRKTKSPTIASTILSTIRNSWRRFRIKPRRLVCWIPQTIAWRCHWKPVDFHYRLVRCSIPHFGYELNKNEFYSKMQCSEVTIRFVLLANRSPRHFHI